VTPIEGAGYVDPCALIIDKKCGVVPAMRKGCPRTYQAVFGETRIAVRVPAAAST
jgi:hypothetical protein